MTTKIKQIGAGLLLAIGLVGCATNPSQQAILQVQEYVMVNRPKAELGVMKWTDYYTGVIEQLKSMPNTVMDKNMQLSGYYYGLEMAKKYEAGEISKDEFYKWRSESNSKASDYAKNFNQVKAECEFESVSRANPNSSVEYAGNNINRKLSSAITGGYEIAMRQAEIFQLCMKAKGFSN